MRLLTFFANQLSALINQIVFEKQNSEAPLVRKVREYIEQRKMESLSLAAVAQASGASVFHADHRRNSVRTLAQRNGAPRPRNFATANLNKIGLMIGGLVRRRA